MALAGPSDPLIAPVMAALDAGDFSDPAAEAEIGWVVDLVTAIRSVRAEMNIPPATLMPLVLAGASAETKARAQRWNDVVKRLARLAEISFADRPPEGAVQLLVRGEVAALPLKGVIDSRPSRRGSRRKSPRPTPTSSASTPSSATRNSSPTRRKRSSRKKRKSARRRWRARRRCWKRWSG